jgi:hypothetical protein
MDGQRIPPEGDGPVPATADEVDIRLPDDPRVPQPDDADPSVSKELGGAAPAVGPGRSSGTSAAGTDAPAADEDG